MSSHCVKHSKKTKSNNEEYVEIQTPKGLQGQFKEVCSICESKKTKFTALRNVGGGPLVAGKTLGKGTSIRTGGGPLTSCKYGRGVNGSIKDLAREVSYKLGIIKNNLKLSRKEIEVVLKVSLNRNTVSNDTIGKLAAELDRLVNFKK